MPKTGEKGGKTASTMGAAEGLRNANTIPAPLQSESCAWLMWGLSGNLGASLEEAIRAFQRKPTWGGAYPGIVRASPALAADGLTPAAAALGLRVVADARVLPGTVYLGPGSEAA